MISSIIVIGLKSLINIDWFPNEEFQLYPPFKINDAKWEPWLTLISCASNSSSSSKCCVSTLILFKILRSTLFKDSSWISLYKFLKLLCQISLILIILLYWLEPFSFNKFIAPVMWSASTWVIISRSISSPFFQFFQTWF